MAVDAGVERCVICFVDPGAVQSVRIDVGAPPTGTVTVDIGEVPLHG